MIMEANKCQNSQWTRQRRLKRARCISLNLKRGWFRTQEEPERNNVLVQRVRKETFLLPQSFCFIWIFKKWTRPTHIGDQSALLSLPLQMLISSRDILMYTTRIRFYQISGNSEIQSDWHTLTITSI